MSTQSQLSSAAVILFFAITSVHSQEARPLSGQDLSDFLGPVSPNLIRWTRDQSIDFQLFNGEAIPPLSGHVYFYLGGHPSFEREPNSTPVAGRLGISRVTWYRSLGKDGLIVQHGLVRLSGYWRVDIWVSAKKQSDVDQLTNIVSQLPLFNKKPERVFGETIFDEYPWLRMPILLIGPALFFGGGWAIYRRLRRRATFFSRRLLGLASYSGFILIFFAAFAFLELSGRFGHPDDFVRTFMLSLVGGALIGALIAAVCLLTFFISALIVRWRGR